MTRPVSPDDSTLQASEAGPTSQGDRVGGSTLGRYVLLRCLGAGGMGVVYAAYDPKLDRKVAIKLLRPNAWSDPEIARVRLLREAQALARISHPNVVAVFDTGTLGEEVFIAMELVEGTTLSAWLRERSRSRREILRRFVAAGRGLAAAHGSGVVHRDFKPDNVLISVDDRVRVLDFGLAYPVVASSAAGGDAGSVRVDMPLTRAGARLGTPSYMAPEQWKGETTSARTDQFAFAVALYEALYGERPFAGRLASEVAEEVTAGRVRAAPRGRRVPARLRRILLRALATSPGARHPHMEALLVALERDPAALLRRVGAPVAVVAALAAGFGLYHREQVRLCIGAEERLRGAWDPQRRAAMQRAFAATARPFAERAFAGTARALDDYAASWVAMQTEACESTRRRGMQSEELLDLRMACLMRRRDELAALVESFVGADAKVVARAVQAMSGLAPVSTCGDLHALRAPVAPPSDPARRAQVVAVGKLLAQVQALEAVGRYAAGLPVAVRAADEASRTAHRPTEAEALSWLGRLQQKNGDPKAAAATLRDAALVAQASGHDEVAAQAWTLLVFVSGSMLGKPDDALSWARHAESAMERLGGPQAEYLRARLDHDVGIVIARQGKLDDAAAHYRRAQSVYERTLGPSHVQVAAVLTDLGVLLEQQGRYEDSAACNRRAVEIAEQRLGPDHPNTALALNNLGAVDFRRGRYAEAFGAFRRALSIREKVLGPSHPQLASTLNNLANSLARQGKYPQALEHCQRAVAIVEKAGLALPAAGEALTTAGDVAEKLGRHAEAAAYQERSLAALARALGSTHPDLAFPLTGLGSAYLGWGKPFRALAPLERALALREGHDGDASDLAGTRFHLARALWGTRGGRARALRLAEQARDTFVGAGSSRQEEAREVAAWLASVARPRRPSR